MASNPTGRPPKLLEPGAPSAMNRENNEERRYQGHERLNVITESEQAETDDSTRTQRNVCITHHAMMSNERCHQSCVMYSNFADAVRTHA